MSEKFNADNNSEPAELSPEMQELAALADQYPSSDAAEANEGQKESIDLHDREKREEINAPMCDSFSKRRCVIADQYPVLKPMSKEEKQRYKEDEDYRAEIDAARAQVPADVRSEYKLLRFMIDQLEEGIHADSRDESPVYTPTTIEMPDGSTMVVTEHRKKEALNNLDELDKLHEKNAEIIDFSRESEVDLGGTPEDIQDKIAALTESMKSLETGERTLRLGDDQEMYDAIEEITAVNYDDMSYEARKQLKKTRYELEKQYIQTRDAFELRRINSDIRELQKEKTAIEARQKEYKNAGFVKRLFRRLVRPNEIDKTQSRLESFDASVAKLEKEREYITRAARRREELENRK